MQSVAEISPTYRRVQRSLQQMTEDFLTTGVAYEKYPPITGTWEEQRKAWRAWSKERTSVLNPSFVRSYMRSVARELKRPFVHANTSLETANHWNKLPSDRWVTVLTVPYRARLQSVVAPIILVATENSRGYGYKPDGVYYKSSVQANWVFNFHGEEAYRVFEHWLEQCKTNPVWRVALGISNHQR